VKKPDHGIDRRSNPQYLSSPPGQRVLQFIYADLMSACRRGDNPGIAKAETRTRLGIAERVFFIGVAPS
jgi:hypothetical protein